MPASVNGNRRGGYGAALLIVLLAVAIILVIYFARGGPSSPSYVETTLKAKERAKEVVSATDLASVYRTLRVYSAGHDGKFPDTPEEVIIETGLPSDYLYKPSQPQAEHTAVYVAGQDEAMPATNILIYQDSLGKDGTCLVLRLGGQAEYLTAEQARAAMEDTARSLAKRSSGAGRAE